VLRILHAFAVLVLVVSALALIGLVGFRLWLPSEQGRRWLAGEVERRTGTKVSFDRLGGSLLWDARIDQLRVGEGLVIPHAHAHWSLKDLIDRKPNVELDLRDLRIRVPRELVPSWIAPPAGPITGNLRVTGPQNDLAIRGDLHAEGGTVIVDGRASLPDRRAEVEAHFRGLEPHVLAADEPMVLSGAMHLVARGRTAHFTVDGVYRHRHGDANVPMSRRGTVAGTLHGGGVIRTTPHLTAHFRLHVRDRGHAARLFGLPSLPLDTMVRGVYEKRPSRPPALRLQTEAP
jgi:hypothetical protein